uniref:YHYH domain-containing protein n=1 Tax=Limnohabitans sp. TaxID=1907725 RepID=UPI0040489E83
MKFLISVLFFVSPGIALAHGGGLDSSGCHNNRKTGDYHCHRAPSTQKQIVQPHQGSETSRQGQPSRLTQGTDPTCYVGPRGGTYTITPSGRKNYNGC